MATLKLNLEDDTAVYVEVRPSADSHDRLREVADTKLEVNFGKVSRSLTQIAESLEAQLKKMTRRPDRLVIELGAELKGEADLWLVAGEAKAHIKVSMTWDAPAAGKLT